jgi:hypothetical protein
MCAKIFNQWVGFISNITTDIQNLRHVNYKMFMTYLHIFEIDLVEF